LTTDTCGFRFEQHPKNEHLPIYQRLPLISSRAFHLFSLASWLSMPDIIKQLKKLFY
jgi:hypothetical protein